MIDITILDTKLSELSVLTSRFLYDPSLKNALFANLSSLELKEMLCKDDSLKDIPKKYKEQYNFRLNSILRKIEETIPKANGEAFHLELYREQMIGRQELLENIDSKYHYV